MHVYNFCCHHLYLCLFYMYKIFHYFLRKMDANPHYQIAFAETELIRLRIIMCNTHQLTLFCQHMVTDVPSRHWVQSILNTIHIPHSCEVVASILIAGLTALLCVKIEPFRKPPRPECYTESPKHVFLVLREPKIIWRNDK